MTLGIIIKNYALESIDTPILKVFNDHNLSILLLDQIFNLAKDDLTKSCQPSSLAFVNKRLYFLLGNKIVEKRAALATYFLSKKAFIFAPGRLHNSFEQVLLPFSKAFEEGNKNKEIDLSNVKHPEFDFKLYNKVTLSPECFFSSKAYGNIWLITTRADLIRFFNATTNAKNIDPFGLIEILNNSSFQKQIDSMFVFYRSGEDSLAELEYKYGEFGSLDVQNGQSLYGYFSDKFSQWRCGMTWWQKCGGIGFTLGLGVEEIYIK